MANIIIKSEERRQFEHKVMRDFGCSPDDASPQSREQAEAIAAYSTEAIDQLKRMEDN